VLLRYTRLYSFTFQQKRLMNQLKMWIGGQWLASETGETLPAENPATGELIAQVPLGSRADVQRAIAAARNALEPLAAMSVYERAVLCHRVADAIIARREELARWVTMDQGRPYHCETLPEVDEAANAFRAAAEDAKRLTTEIIPAADPYRRVLTYRRPRGVYAIIVPWNWPIGVAANFLAAGLATGNAAVWVSAPTTAACSIKFAEAIAAADLPPGAINLVTGIGAVVGDEAVANPDTDAVAFTGSSQTGEQVMRRAAGKPVVAELGGNGPLIVFEDADLGLLEEAVTLGCFMGGGQSCSASERVLVHERVYEAFVERALAAARAVKLGDPLDSATTMGPLNNEATAAKMDRHLEDATRCGATVRAGGGRAPGFPTKLFYQPTVVTGVNPDMLIANEESFGPVVPILTPFRTDAEALALAERDQSGLGLLASVYTRDTRRAMWFGDRLKAGIVNVNLSTNSSESHVPFGGASGRRSGVGRIGGKYTLLEMTDLRTIVLNLR
jgi:acyl-CoA reductase-like NAD-dependent aldehyde dehydrogenase